MHMMDCSCAPILQFFSAVSVGATAERQIQNRIFGQYFTTLMKDSVASYTSIWTLFSPAVRGLGMLWARFTASVRGTDVLCNALNISQFRWLVAPQDSLICGGNILRRKRNRPNSCAIYFVELGLLFTLQLTPLTYSSICVWQSCRYALSSMGRCFCF